MRMGQIWREEEMVDWAFYFFRVPKKVKHGYRNVIEPNFCDQCLAAGVAFFFKQWGDTTRRRRGVYWMVERRMKCLELQG